jgi:protein SCO1
LKVYQYTLFVKGWVIVLFLAIATMLGCLRSGDAEAGQAGFIVGGPFTLVDHTGATVTNETYRGKWLVMFFGFTHCPDICPAELQVMSESLEALGPKADLVVPIFITLDPQRDTPEIVGDYVKNFGPRFVGLTGSPEAIADAAKAYRIPFSKFVPDGQEDNQNYSIDHAAIAYLMGPDGKYLEHFAYGTPATKMTETLRRYL